MNYETYSEKEGYISYGDASHCIQDEEGFLWFGSNKGLYRYDGSQFRHYLLQPKNNHQIPATKYFPLLLSKNQLLVWIENRGVFWFNIKSRQLDKILFLNEEDFFSHTKVCAAYKFDSQTIWFTTLFRGIVRYDLKSNNITQFLFSSDTLYNKSWISSSTCSNLAKSEDGTFYIATNDGLFHFYPGDGKFEKVNLPNQIAKINTFTNVYIQDKVLYACTWGHGLLTYDFINKRWQQFLWNKKVYNNTKNICSSLIFKTKSEIWISTIDEGLKILDLKTNLFSEVVMVDKNGNDVIPTPWFLFNGKDDICWGTDQGLIYKIYNKQKLLHFKPLIDRSLRLQCKYFYRFPNDSILYFLTDQQRGINSISLKTGEMQFFSSPSFIKNPSFFNTISSYSNNKKKLLVTNQESTFLFDAITKKYEKIPNVSDLKLTKTSIGSVIDGYDNLWISIPFKGLYSYNKKRNHLQEISPKDLQMVIPNTSSIIEILPSLDSGLWITNKNGFGLVYYNQKRNVALNYSVRYPILTNNAISICRLKEDAIFICLADWGVVMIKNPNSKREKMYHFYDVKDGSPSNKFYNCLVDENNQVWLTSDHGIFQFNPVTYKFTHHFSNEQIVNHDNDNNLFIIPNQGVGIGVNQGFHFWHQDEIKKQLSSRPPKAVLNDVYIGKKYMTDSSLSALPLEMQYNEKLQFKISGREFMFPEKLNYAYRLQGLENTWHTANLNQQIEYARIKGGNYMLQIKTSYDLINWNEDAYQLSIAVIPPFWEMLWFIILCSIILILLVFFLFQSRMNKLKKEAAIKLALRESELKALRSQMNPHFIFNCMNTLEAFILNNDEEHAADLVQKFSQLMRMVLENSQFPLISIKKDIEALRLYIQLEQIRFKFQFEYIIEGLSSMDLEHVQVPPLIIQPFVENAILHGIRPLKTKGALKISLSMEKNFLCIIVDDNGVGRKEKVVKTQTHQSLGTYLSENRINKLHSENSTAIEYIDKIDSNGAALGTTVKIKIPI